MIFQILMATILFDIFFTPVQAETTRTWRTVSELSETERADIDLRVDMPRDAQIPYLPAEKYPFSPPYTAEEMGYRAMEFPHMPRWSAAFADGFGSITGSGFLQQAKTAGGALAVHADGVAGYLYATPPGGEYFRWLFQDTAPPESYGNQTLMVGYRTDQTFSTRLDSFFYSPSLRRVWFLAPLKFVEEIRSPEEFYLRPHLDREKFPQDRRIEIPAELEERVRAQEEAGRLVFTSAVQARSR
jgi:hypothetical protein